MNGTIEGTLVTQRGLLDTPTIALSFLPQSQMSGTVLSHGVDKAFGFGQIAGSMVFIGPDRDRKCVMADGTLFR